jgi:predicted nucleic acid-binding protein
MRCEYLVDANVLSEPTKPAPDPRVVAWLRAHAPDIAVDPVILGELRLGIIAATAVVHGMAVVTRNRADFVNAGVRIGDPFRWMSLAWVRLPAQNEE